ncbi:antitoxin of toxin-antitoxin stability system [Methylobacterium sp. J-076]|uniref:antitoxin of toxin-antitoxin stability system n=1 Tax=Methylobacterium sp. J-076 TaxID=2836655 RepID=UPI001FBB9A40|nr:antitoxin of toxin-antitoxin stability system [Methylobacterium sp. J-076]MCJ2011698.1 antitoxin of toxin-antitoxin stability system [Methylobacterium sp. J-076]
MPRVAVFTMKLEAGLRDAVMAEAEASHRPASQAVRALMREFIPRQREGREHAAFLERKVAAARASARDGQGRSHGAVEAAFAARRARPADQT